MEYFSNKGKEGIRIMKKIRLLLTHLLITAMIMASASPAYVYADELVPIGSSAEISDEAAEGDVEILSGDTDAEDISVSEDVSDTEVLDSDSPEGDEALSDGFFADGAGTITKIEAPKKTEYTFEYKKALSVLLREFPKKIKAYRGNDSEDIKVTWKCEVNYSKDLDEYPFVAELKGYKLAKDVKLPRLTVRFTKGKWDKEPPATFRDETLPDVAPPKESDFLDKISLPRKYSNKKQYPKVEDQNPYGTCWSFSTLGAMVGDLLMDGATKKPNFSELQLIYYATHEYTDPKKCRTDSVKTADDPKTYMNVGGTKTQGPNLLSNHVGAINESDLPYTEENMWNFKGGSGGNEYLTSKDVVHLKNAYYIMDNNLDRIKRAIVQHGGVATGYKHDWDYYDETYASYYIPKVVNYGGHAITFVGWDDDFSKEHFNTGSSNPKPKKNGAWLVRNSWGLYDGSEDGYFWLSYEDASWLDRKFVVAYDAVVEPADNCYSYDGENTIGDTFFNLGKSGAARVSYKVNKGEAVKSVGLILFSSDANVKVTVTNKKTGDSSTGNVKTTYPGFYTVKLKNELYIPNTADVEVVINLSSENDIYLSGEIVDEWSYIVEETGKPVKFKSVCDNGCEIKTQKSGKYEKRSYDPRIKLYTVKSSGPKKVKVTGVTLDKTSKTLKVGKTLKLTATVKPKNATNKKVTWKSSNKKVAKVSSKGKVTALKKGEATITVTTADGNKKAKCKIKVKKK